MSLRKYDLWSIIQITSINDDVTAYIGAVCGKITLF